ncbi:MAG TPA: hypothetical protein PKA58_28555, partial [Polyangium sp.]|nr:hypothetical protein [Polyangium sp.]
QGPTHVTAAWLLRRRLTTAVSRRALGMLLLYPIALLVHRIFAIPQGQSIPTMLTTDMIISAILSTSFAIAIFSRVAWLSLVFLLGAYTIQRIPEQSTMVFIGFGTLGAIFLIVLWLRFTREQTSEKEA